MPNTTPMGPADTFEAEPAPPTRTLQESHLRRRAGPGRIRPTLEKTL
jgi:hypothetical protein